jgi:hypothetical protein
VRIVYCPKGHRVVVPAWFDDNDPANTHDRWHFSYDRKCDDCFSLVWRAKPFKAKRQGES